MKLTKKQIDLLKRKTIVALATSDLNYKPRVIFVEVNQVKDNLIIITDNEMKITKKNLLENNKVALLAFEEDYSYCLKILGKAKYYKNGKWLNYVKKLKENKGLPAKGAIVVKVEKIIESK